MRPLIVCVLFASVMASPAAAQELPTTPGAVATFEVQAANGVLRTLTDQYVRGDWEGFAATARGLVTGIAMACPTWVRAPQSAADCPALQRDFVLLVWPGRLPAATDPTLLNAVVHRGSREPYSRVLPGLDDDSRAKLLEIFVSDNTNASIVSYYVSKPLPDPVLAQVPNVVGTFAGPLFTALNAVAEQTTNIPGFTIKGVPDPTAAPSPTTPLLAAVRRLRLPEPRAGVEATLSATLPITEDDFMTELEKLGQALLDRGLGDGDRLQPAREQSVDAIRDAGARCQMEGTDAGVCRGQMHRAISDEIGPVRRGSLEEWERTALEMLEASLRAFVDRLQPKTVGGKAVLDNSPLTKIGFGVLTAWALNPADNRRAKIDKDAVVRDSLSRALQIVTLNWTPWGIQDKTTRSSPGWRAAVRPFVGVAYSPNIGVSGGATVMFWSNLGMNVGWTTLFVPEPNAPLEFGDDLNLKIGPKDADNKPTLPYKFDEGLRRDPLRLDPVGSWFVGLSYNFK